MLTIEIAYANQTCSTLFTIQVPPSTTLLQAIMQSGVLSDFPEIDLMQQKVGVFGEIKSLNDHIENGDRIEIYRPLLQDPMKARKLRVTKQRQQRLKDRA